MKTPPPYFSSRHARIRRTFRHTLFIPRPSEFYVVLLLHPFHFRRSSSPTARCFPSYDMKKFFRRNPLPLFFLPPHRTKKILTKPTKKSIIKHILCGYVGTGRQDGLRIRWETVQVRALLSAPRKAGKTAKTVCFFDKNPFFKNTPQTHPKIKSLLFFSKAVQMGCLFPAMRIYAIGRTGANTQVFLCPSRQLGYMTAPPAGSSVRD